MFNNDIELMTDLKKYIKERAEKLAKESDVPYELAQETIEDAISDSLITKDSELNDKFIADYIDWKKFQRKEVS